MKKINIIFLMFIIAIMTTACSKVPAGNVGVKVNLYGSSKGVDMEELSPGKYWIGVNEDLYIFPTFTQNYVWTQDVAEGSENDESITFQTIEGMSVGADVGISYAIDPKKVSIVFQKYRKGIDEITDVFMRNMVRDAFNKAASSKPVEHVYGKGKSALIKEVEDIVSGQCLEIGINLERVYFIGSLRLPTTVTKSLNRKIAATQKAQERENQVRETEAKAMMDIAKAKGEAESKRIMAQGEADKILIEATATAKANRKVANSLTDKLIKYQSIKEWDGVLPKMTGVSGMPMISMESK